MSDWHLCAARAAAIPTVVLALACPARPPQTIAPDDCPDGGAASSVGDPSGGCADILAEWNAILARYVGEDILRCAQDSDCACYGGPQCPNVLIHTCPMPIRADIARTLTPVSLRYAAQDCPIIWSPHYCDPKCVNGRCESVVP